MVARANNNLVRSSPRKGWWLSKHSLRRPPTPAKSSAKLSWHGASRAAREEACFPKGKLPKILRRSERAAKRPGKISLTENENPPPKRYPPYLLRDLTRPNTNPAPLSRTNPIIA